MRTTKKDLEKRLEVLKEISGIDNLEFDYNSVYGGYRLITVDSNSGAHYGAFGESSCVGRVKAGEMLSKINSIIYGIEYEQRKASK